VKPNLRPVRTKVKIIVQERSFGYIVPLLSSCKVLVDDYLVAPVRDLSAGVRSRQPTFVWVLLFLVVLVAAYFRLASRSSSGPSALDVDDDVDSKEWVNTLQA
jgi:hypothetical protein